MLSFGETSLLHIYFAPVMSLFVEECTIAPFFAADYVRFSIIHILLFRKAQPNIPNVTQIRPLFLRLYIHSKN